MHYITQELQKTYNTNAKHFSQTRKKHWPEIEHIIAYINTLPQQSINILELGCGDGRLYEHIKKNTHKTIQYTGVDISDKLLDIGKKQHPTATFVHADMVDYIQTGKQESVDIFISIAAFHHLANRQQRLIVLKNIYRLLRYNGSYIMTNRALSDRFMKKYRKSLVQSTAKYIISIGQKDRRDVYITWNKKGRRYYHIFSKIQLENLGKVAGFNIQESCYIEKNGNKSQNKRQARNTMTVLQKSAVTYASSSS